MAQRVQITPPNPKPEFYGRAINLLRAEVGSTIALFEGSADWKTDRLIERHFAYIDAMMALQYQATGGNPPKMRWFKENGYG